MVNEIKQELEETVEWPLKDPEVLLNRLARLLWIRILGLNNKGFYGCIN